MPVPGWYLDPVGPGMLRWWDGGQWTGHAAPLPRPAPAWYPDPGGMTALRWFDGMQWTTYLAPYPPPPPPALDRTIAEQQHLDPRPWGLRPVLVPIAAYVLLIVSGSVAAATLEPSGGTGLTVFDVVLNVLIETALAVAVYLAGRDVARRAGGWRRAFGFRWPRTSDLLPALAGIGLALALRTIVGIVMTIIAGPDATKQAQNLHVGRSTIVTTILIVVLAVIAAPIVEELVFRGMMLRTFMRRLGFWPAAVLSTTIFALGHVYEVNTLVGAVGLALSVAALGIVNCGLVRRTDSLAPGMIVHASFNLLAVVLLLSLGT
jgi:membrane protease YdiL (CAAX protease family)